MMAPDTRALVEQYGLNPETATDYQLECLATMLRAEALPEVVEALQAAHDALGGSDE